ncbi:MAG TPA: GxxExxY protein [bacterium]|nr:GxxExxY protein [bacterium]HPN81621.1 GxxExxY protein [bacterium]HPW39520.1 GxxExxY protein [bacterium]
MNGDSGKVVYKELSFKIVGILFEVYNELGYGYREKYYEEAIARCFIKDGIKFQRQLACDLIFKGEKIGINFLDFLVEDKIILELKKGNSFSKNNIEQVRNYLEATGKRLAILANFTSKGVKFLRVLG